MIARSHLALAIAILAASPWPAAAQERRDDALRDEAKRKFQEGRQHYDRHEYELAITAFAEAYRLSREPLLLFNIAQSHRLKGDCASAMTFYRRYLEADPHPSNQVELDAAIERCKGVEPPAPTPPPRAEPPATQPAATPAPVVPVAPPPEPEREPAPAGSRRKLIGWIVSGAGGAVLATGLAFGAVARSKWHDALEMCDDDRVCSAQGHALAEDARTAGNVATILVGIGAAAAVTGAVLILTAPDEHTVGVAVAGRF